MQRDLRCVLVLAATGLVLACGHSHSTPDSAPDANEPVDARAQFDARARPDTPDANAPESGERRDAQLDAPAVDAPIDAAPSDSATLAPDGTFAPSDDCTQPEPRDRCDSGLCWVNPGCFVMGVPRDQLGAGADSDRQVQVTLTNVFLLGETEVTRAQWQQLGLPLPDPDWSQQYKDVPNPTAPENGDHQCDEPDCPVHWLTFEDTLAYVNLLSEAEELPRCYELADCEGAPGEGLRCRQIATTAPTPYDCHGYRLPTEAEWEYATKAGTTTSHYSGQMSPNPGAVSDCEIDPPVDAIAWYCANSDNRPHPVGRKQPNGWGLHDMSGNVLEYINDIFDPWGYGEGPHVDPLFGIENSAAQMAPPEHPVWGANTDTRGFPTVYRVIRGGVYFGPSTYCTSGNRLRASSGRAAMAHGFRVARTLEALE